LFDSFTHGYPALFAFCVYTPHVYTLLFYHVGYTHRLRYAHRLVTHTPFHGYALHFTFVVFTHAFTVAVRTLRLHVYRTFTLDYVCYGLPFGCTHTFTFDWFFCVTLLICSVWIRSGYTVTLPHTLRLVTFGLIYTLRLLLRSLPPYTHTRLRCYVGCYGYGLRLRSVYVGSHVYRIYVCYRLVGYGCCCCYVCCCSRFVVTHVVFAFYVVDFGLHVYVCC